MSWVGTAPRAFLKTRRVGAVAIVSIIGTVALLLLHPTAYGIPGFNNVRDTPFSYLIGFVLGSLSSTLAHSVTPAMEGLATRRVARARAVLLAVATLVQGLLLILAATILRELAGIDIPWDDVSVFLTSTLFFHGVGFLSAGLFAGPRMWILPAAFLSVFLAFSWKDEYTIQPWNVVLTTSGPLVASAAVLYVLGLAAVFFGEPRAD